MTSPVPARPTAPSPAAPGTDPAAPASAAPVTNAGLFDAARAVIPGGVDSPVRAFGSVGGAPVFIAGARGARVRDVEGREYVDLVGSGRPPPPRPSWPRRCAPACPPPSGCASCPPARRRP